MHAYTFKKSQSMMSKSTKLINLIFLEKGNNFSEFLKVWMVYLDDLNFNAKIVVIWHENSNNNFLGGHNLILFNSVSRLG